MGIRSKLVLASAVLIGSLASAPVASAGNAYFFGDSLTDCCHYGRTTNGPNWADLLPPQIGASYTATAASNYAVGGAQSGGATWSDFLSQVGRFTASNTTIRPDDVVGIWIGTNDVWGSSFSVNDRLDGARVVGPIGYMPDAVALTSYVVGNIVSGISELRADGFRNVVLLSTYDLGRAGVEPNATAAALATQYSTALTAAERNLSFDGMTTYFVDVQSLLQRVQASPSAFGFLHTTGFDGCAAAACTTQSVDVQNTYVFQDRIHLTTAFDRLLAADAASVINAGGTAVPEPMSVALLFTGLVCIGVARAARRPA